MTIAILGGTGPQGRGLAKRFAAAGVPVAIGSRKSEHAMEVADQLTAVLPANSASINGYDNAGAVAAADEMVILAVPWPGHNQTLEALKKDLSDKILIDIVVPLKEGSKENRYASRRLSYGSSSSYSWRKCSSNGCSTQRVSSHP